jgi:tetratricopeptide (TPR) repeat protein
MPPFWKAEVLSQVGLVLYDFGAAKEALDCEVSAMELYDRAGTPDRPELRKGRRARSLKREALVHGPFLDAAAKSTAFDALKEAKSVARASNDNQALLSASWVEATLKSNLGRLNEALKIVEESLPLGSKADKWTLVGLHIEAARGYQRFRDKKKAIQHYQEASRLCETHQIIPIPLPADGALIILDPGFQLRALGKVSSDLISPRGANPFTEKVMKALYSAVS